MRRIWIVQCKKCKSITEMHPETDLKNYQEQGKCIVCGSIIEAASGKWMAPPAIDTDRNDEEKEIDLLEIEK